MDRNMVVIDFETTGLEPGVDDILSVSIIDDNENVLLNTLCRSTQCTSWEAAQAVHGITPEMVADKKSFESYIPQVLDILSNADRIVAYNVPFEDSFLKSYGIYIPEEKWIDPMIIFAEIYGEWNEYHQDYKWQKLSKCAEYYDYEFKAHDSLEDVKATLYCLKKMAEQGYDVYA